MNKNEFVEILIKYNIDPNIVCFNDKIKDDVFCFMDNYNAVDVFYRERGREFDLQKFSTQSDALEYLSNKILVMSGKL